MPVRPRALPRERQQAAIQRFFEGDPGALEFVEDQEEGDGFYDFIGIDIRLRFIDILLGMHPVPDLGEEFRMMLSQSQRKTDFFNNQQSI